MWTSLSPDCSATVDAPPRSALARRVVRAVLERRRVGEFEWGPLSAFSALANVSATAWRRRRGCAARVCLGVLDAHDLAEH